MIGAALLRFAILLAPVLLVLATCIDVLLFLRSSRARTEPLYLEQVDGDPTESDAA